MSCAPDLEINLPRLGNKDRMLKNSFVVVFCRSPMTIGDAPIKLGFLFQWGHNKILGRGQINGDAYPAETQ